MKNAVGRRKFAPNPWEERWTPAFPISEKGKNQAICGQKNYCYVCVANKPTSSKAFGKNLPRSAACWISINATALKVNAEIGLE